MAQYFTDRLQRVFHLIFMSYDPQSAQEGLRILESIVNNRLHHKVVRTNRMLRKSTRRLYLQKNVN